MREPPDFDLVDRVRAASRLMVRELGFMRPTLAATDYPPSAVHSLIEIGERGAMTAADLADVLGLEKSSISRLLGKLTAAGELTQTAAGDDARFKRLALTPKGRRTLASIHRYARQRVTDAASYLAPRELTAFCEGLARYAEALRAHRLGRARAPEAPLAIASGYRPGLIGRIAQMHADYYVRYPGLGRFFESRVASGMADLAGRLDREANEVWSALRDGRIVGSIAIDGEDLGKREAHLRFFILDEDARGRGMGRALLAQATRFCDERGFARTRLWTFKGLDAARCLYEEAGFALAWERRGTQWGTQLIEQSFVRSAPRARGSRRAPAQL